jgi:hypothetical protein
MSIKDSWTKPIELTTEAKGENPLTYQPKPELSTSKDPTSNLTNPANNAHTTPAVTHTNTINPTKSHSKNVPSANFSTNPSPQPSSSNHLTSQTNDKISNKPTNSASRKLPNYPTSTIPPNPLTS